MKSRFIVFVFLIIFISSSVASFCQNDRHTPKVQVVQVGFTSSLFYEVDSRDAQVAIKIWSKEVLKGMKDSIGTFYEPNVTIYNELSSLQKRITEGAVEFLSISTLDYFEIKNQIDFEPILMGEFLGNVGEENILLVHREAGLSDLQSLDGGDLIVHPGQRGLIAQMWLSILLMKQGLPECEKFLGTIRTSSKASQAILPVFFKQADACIVNRQAFDTMAEMNPQLKEQLQILASSPVFAYGLNLLSKKFDTKTKNEMLKIALDVDRHPRGKQILTLFRQDKAIRFEPHHLASIERLLAEYNELKTKGAKER